MGPIEHFLKAEELAEHGDNDAAMVHAKLCEIGLEVESRIAVIPQDELARLTKHETLWKEILYGPGSVSG